MIWIVYNTSTGAVISYSETEPNTLSNESKTEVDFNFGDSTPHIYKYDGSGIIKNDSIWVVYNDSDGSIVSTGAKEPSVDSGQSKALVNHVFNLLQPTTFWKVSGGAIVENNEETEKSDDDLGYKYYVSFNYARSTSSSKTLYTGKSTNSSNNAGRYDSNNVIPHMIPCGCKISKVNIVCAGMASSSNADNGILDFQIDLINAKTTGSEDVIKSLQIPIDGSKYNIGDRYNRNSDLDIRESYPLDIDVPDNTMLSSKFTSQFGADKIVAFRYLHLTFELTEV